MAWAALFSWVYPMLMVLFPPMVHDDPDFVLERRSLLSDLQMGTLTNRFVVLELGDLEPGKKGIIKWTIVNDSDKPFKIIEVVQSQDGLQGKVISAANGNKQEVLCQLELDVPVLVARNETEFRLDLKSADDSVWSMRVRFRYRGMVCFKNWTFDIFVPPNVKEIDFSVPILTTPPVVPEELEISLSQELQAFTARYANQAIQMKAEASKVPEYGVAGTITIRNPKSKLASSIQCYVTRRPSIHFSPRLIRFVKVDNKKWEGTALIKVDRSEWLPKDDAASLNSSAVHFAAKFSEKDWSLTFDHEPVSENVYKVHLVATWNDEAKVFAFPKSMEWELVTLKSTRNMPVSCQFLK